MQGEIPIVGYGKVFEEMFTGSMYGQSAAVFVVWVYAISHMKQKGQVCYVEINPRQLAPAIGLTPEEVLAAVAYLEEPDVESRSPGDEGRRLVFEGSRRHGGPQTYRVVNGFKYRMGTSEAGRRAMNAWRQRKAVAKRRAIADGMVFDDVAWMEGNPRPGAGMYGWDAEEADAPLAVQRPMDRGVGQ